ncbi:MAG: ATP-binding protein [Roseiflexaceae bacterium]|nr:ATP-binding protein [Roseiflexaceae bacterium]
MKILLPYLLVTVFVASIGGGVGMFFVVTSAEERVQNLLAQIARSTTDELVRRERNHLDFLLLVASAPATQGRPSVADAFDNGDAQQVQSVLAPYYGLGVSNITLDIDRMVAFDRNGKTYVDWLRVEEAPDKPPQLIDGTNLVGLDVVKQVLSGTLIDGNDKFSNLIYFLPDRQPYFYTAAPIKKNGQIVGGVMIAIKVDRLLLALQKSSQAAVTSFYDVSGAPIGTTLLNRDELEGLRIPPQIVQQLATRESQSVYTVALRQRDYRLFYSPLQLANQQVGYFSVGISGDFQFQSISISRNVIIVMAIVFGLTSFVVGALVVRLINRPLSNLVQTAQAVTAGDFGRRSTVQSQDEIGQLAIAFNQMTEHLLRLYTASRDLNVAIKVDSVLEVAHRTVQSFAPDSEVLALLEDNGTLRYRFGPQVEPATHMLTSIRVATSEPLLAEMSEIHTPIVTSVDAEPRLAELGLHLAGYTSLLLAPLVVQDRLSGLLVFGNRTIGAFSGVVEPTLTAVANMTGSVLYNAILFDRVQGESSRRRAILESIADGVIVCDRQRNIVLANPAAEQMLAIRDWENARRNFNDIPLARVEAVQDVFGEEGTLQHYRLNERVLSLSSAPVITDSGTSLGEVIVLHDVSSEVALNLAKTNFIATISHELRSPLTVIMGYSDLLLRGLVGELTADQRELLEAVRNRVDLMANIIKNVITVANIEADTLQTEIEPQELWMAVDQVAGPLRSSFTRKGLEMSVQISKDLPPVLADREQLQLILNQLLDNARRYTQAGGVTISAEQLEDYIHINISDTGPGIAADQQPLLFTHFYRVDGNSSPERGIGLGLVITRQLVERQGGRVWASSQPGSGSTFGFSLPIAHEHNIVITNQDKPRAATGT